MQPSYRYLDISHADGVATVLLSRPPANAVNVEMYQEIARCFRQPDALGTGVNAIVLAAEGRHFCAGNDLDEFATMNPDNATERMWRVREAFFAISGCPVPVVGAVHGAALGTGLAIAGSCDFVVAEPDARFGLPELTVGVMGGARHLARMAPQPLVRRMYLTGEPMAATDFKAHGGCIFISAPGAHRQEAQALAVRIAAFSPTAVRVSKRILDRVETMDLEDGYRFEQAGTERMSGHRDSKEALTAFREKRSPRYDLSIDLTMFD